MRFAASRKIERGARNHAIVKAVGIGLREGGMVSILKEQREAVIAG